MPSLTARRSSAGTADLSRSMRELERVRGGREGGWLTSALNPKEVRADLGQISRT